MIQFNKVAIVGVGLIGGSIGLAIKKRKLAREVVGVFRRRSTLKKAVKRGAIDKGFMDLKSGVEDADLVILATPVMSIPIILREALKYAKLGAILTDVGSTKDWIVRESEKAIGTGEKVFFVGSHPMAGSEHTGVEFAVNGLLEGAPCIVTSTYKTKRSALEKIIRLWRSLGSRVEVMSPSRHDAVVALISHLPHFAAFSIASAVPGPLMRFAAEGFKDTTRVASSDPALWADIFFTNKKQVLKAAALFIKDLKKIAAALSKGDYAKTVRLLAKAKSKRDKFL